MKIRANAKSYFSIFEEEKVGPLALDFINSHGLSITLALDNVVNCHKNQPLLREGVIITAWSI